MLEIIKKRGVKFRTRLWLRLKKKYITHFSVARIASADEKKKIINGQTKS